MKVMFDLNIVLLAGQQHESHYQLLAAKLSTVVQGEAQGVIPYHGVTTFPSLLSR